MPGMICGYDEGAVLSSVLLLVPPPAAALAIHESSKKIRGGVPILGRAEAHPFLAFGFNFDVSDLIGGNADLFSP
jgi:hypothetical protein